MTSFWWLILFFIGFCFIYSLGIVMCKKYAKTNGKDSKYVSAMDIRITGGGAGSAGCSAGGSAGGSVGGAGIFISCIDRIFFYII